MLCVHCIIRANISEGAAQQGDCLLLVLLACYLYLLLCVCVNQLGWSLLTSKGFGCCFTDVLSVSLSHCVLFRE